MSDVALCEHGEIEVACLDCFGKPRKLAPQAKVTQRTTKTPSSINDTIAPFTGDLDLSMGVDDIPALVGGSHLPARIFPHHLRRGGWVYLRSAEALEARVKAKKMVWNDEQAEPGMTLEVDPATWTSDLGIELGWLAVQQQTGYRYLATNEDGTVVHYKGGKPVVKPEEDDDE